MEPVEVFEVGEATVSIYLDTYPLNPRKDYDNAGVMACAHRRYDLGDYDLEREGVENLRAHLREVGAVIVLPLYLYDHGGISISVGGFSDAWDSGQVGVIYMTGEVLRENWGTSATAERQARAIACLEAEVKEYDRYLRGEVYGYAVEAGGVEVDSCWGFFGWSYAKESAIAAGEDADAHYRAESLKRGLAVMAYAD